MKRIYVAGKLNDDAIGYINNLHKMFGVAEMVRKAGFAVFIPGLDILMGLKFGTWTYDDYFNNSQPWLDAADAVFVGSGWETSEGTKREIARAQKNGIPVYYDLNEMIEKEK